ncbi:50S ribosomal protein L4 [Patescibacteria group bacterium]|nr:MAG: 50S ribosomal protein L4 [Patescibacteria group bacterium]
MLSVAIYNREGKKVGERELSPVVFGVTPRPAVLHETVLAAMANARRPVAHTKTRGEVRGGGKKPWRQKGTGRARHGSIRSPIWIGGGVTFGPRSERNFSVKLNRKKRNLAIRMSLSDKAAHGHLVVLDELILPEFKTKAMAKILEALPVQAKKILLVMPARDEKVSMSSRNIPGLRTANAQSLSILEVIGSGMLLTTTKGVDVLERLFEPKTETAETATVSKNSNRKR